MEFGLAIQRQQVEAIRAVFVEGQNIFPDSAIFDLAHVQIVINKTRVQHTAHKTSN